MLQVSHFSKFSETLLYKNKKISYLFKNNGRPPSLQSEYKQMYIGTLPLLRKTQFYFIYIKQQQGFRIDNRGVNHRKSEPKILFKEYPDIKRALCPAFGALQPACKRKSPRADGIALLPRDKQP